jgi:hypothetical protein
LLHQSTPVAAGSAITKGSASVPARHHEQSGKAASILSSKKRGPSMAAKTFSATVK